MSKIAATLIAGLFATSVFAQTPAATTHAQVEATKDAAHADAKHAKEVAKADDRVVPDASSAARRLSASATQLVALEGHRRAARRTL